MAGRGVKRKASPRVEPDQGRRWEPKPSKWRAPNRLMSTIIGSHFG